MAIQVTDAMRTKITEYIGRESSVTLSDKNKRELLPVVEAKMVQLAEMLLDKVREQAAKSTNPPLHSKFQYRTSLYTEPSFFAHTIGKIFKDVFDITCSADWDVGTKKPDTFLETLAPEQSGYYITFSWLSTNNHIGQTAFRAKAPKVEELLRTEWNALQKGVGVDLEVTFKESEAPALKMHQSKLLMHSHYFAKMQQGKFEDSLELSGKRLVLDPQDCTSATFQLLVQCIYLGKVEKADMKPNEWVAFYKAADFYQMPLARAYAVCEIENLIAQKKMGKELFALFQLALGIKDEELLAFCLHPIIQDFEPDFIRLIDKSNFEALYNASKSCPKARDLILQARRFNRELMDLPLPEVKAAAPASAAASSSSK